MKQVYFCLALIIALLTSCTYDLDTEYNSDSQDYLFLPEETDFSKLSSSELQIIREAASRLPIKRDEVGLFWSPIKSAKQINVSDNIFKFFISSIENSNLIILSEGTSFRNEILSRSPEDDCNYFRRTDCLAWSIAAAIGDSYENVSPYLYENFEGGRVPFSQRTRAMGIFGTVTVYEDYSYFPSSWTTDQMPLNNIVAISNPDGSYHAVNGLYIEGQYIYVMDYQIGTISRGEMVMYDVNRIHSVYTIIPFQH